MKHTFTIFAVALFSLHEAVAQEEPLSHTLTFQYTLSIPLGNTSDFIGKSSFRGGTFDYKFHIHDAASIGASLGWYTFFEKQEPGTYTIREETLTLTGNQYRYVNSIPILFTGNYFLGNASRYTPFVGVGIGTTYNAYRLEMGMYTLEVDTWHFTLAPELGVRVKVADGLSTYFSARYHNNFETTDLSTQSYLGLNIGMMWRL
jgi:hypothetical protein